MINMAHREFMALGAYTTYLTSIVVGRCIRGAMNVYLVVASLLAFSVAFTVGYGVEWALIRYLYKRTLDTLLATCGLSLVMQQTFGSAFGAQEVGVPMPDWLLGSWKATETIDIPLNGLFVMGLSLTTTLAFCCRSGLGGDYGMRRSRQRFCAARTEDFSATRR